MRVQLFIRKFIISVPFIKLLISRSSRIIGLKAKIKNFGIDTRLCKVDLTWFEKGFKITSNKMGSFLFLFGDIQNDILVYKNTSNPLLIFKTDHPLFFKKFSQPFLIIKFTSIAKTKLFYPFCEWLQTNSIYHEDINQLPSNLISD